jgi:hypothetical protein
MRINRTQTEDYLRKTKLPQATKSYTVISHSTIIDTLRTKLDEKGFIIKSELYKAEDTGDVAMAFIQIENSKDPDMGMTFNWTNSYNKKIRFGCSVGGFIYDNEVPFISSSNAASWLRKHTGTALNDTMQVIDAMIESAEDHFDAIIAMKDKFKSIEVSRKDYAKLIGLLYLDKKILTPNQVSLIRVEYDKPSFDYKDKGTLWELYKMIMFGIAENSPKKWYEQQMQISAYIQVMYNVAVETNIEDATDQLKLELESEEDESTETVTEEVNMESIDNLIQAQNMIQEADYSKKERLEEIRTELDNETVSYGELVELEELSEFIEEDDVQLLEAAGVPEFEDDVILPAAPMSVEEVELVQEEFGIIETGSPDDGYVGSTADTDSLFDLTEEVEETQEEIDTMSLFTEEPKVQSIVPQEFQERVDEMLTSQYQNKRRVVDVTKGIDHTVFELDSKEFFVLEN